MRWRGPGERTGRQRRGQLASFTRLPRMSSNLSRWRQHKRRDDSGGRGGAVDPSPLMQFAIQSPRGRREKDKKKGKGRAKTSRDRDTERLLVDSQALTGGYEGLCV